MPAKVTEIELEKRARSIENTTILKIWYQQMEDGTQSHNCVDYHSVETAIYLQAENKKIFRISWADEFGLHHGFGISIREIRMIDKSEGLFTEVTNDKDWKGMVGIKIESVQIHWQNVIENMRSGLVPMLGMGFITRRDYPQTIEINFETGQQVFVSAMKITEDSKCVPFTNHVTVFFEKKMIDRYYKPLRKR
jgi:hypothetical protein